ncbi:MAG TPA: hypothetical protein VEY12_00365, partial [Thermoplasmata archaeon]|nr:hypothetical protein [Thermoplasmata archaeon]
MPRGGSVTWLKALVLGVFAALLSTGASPFFGAAAPVRSAPTSWVVSGPDFANGTFQNTTLAANGSLELAARARPSNRTMVLDVGAPGSADSSYLTAPCVLREANGPYEMWYTGVSGGGYSILLATSPDGVNWTKKGVVLSGVLTPSTLKIGATYHMWYALYMQGSGPLGYTDEIYHATSPDGVAWNVQGLALGLGPTGSWDAAIVAYPWVVQDSGGL